MSTKIKYSQVELPCTQEMILLCCKGQEALLSGKEGKLKSPFDPSAQSPISEIPGELVWQSVRTLNTESSYTFALAEPFNWDGELELEEDPFPKIDNCLFYMAADEDLGERVEQNHGKQLRLVEDSDA